MASSISTNTSSTSSSSLHTARPLQHHANDAVLYNPAELSTWVDSLLTEFIQPASNFSSTLNVPYPINHASANAWTADNTTSYYDTQQIIEEDSSIRLVHVLMSCADSVQRGNLSLAGAFIEELQILLSHVNSEFGFGKVAAYFIDALSRRVFKPLERSHSSAHENEILYHHFYEACPYLKFAHFTSNQAILEAFDGHDCVHVIDFNLMQGLQWPALIQALALRPNGPPVLRLTGIGPPSLDGHDPLRETGLRLAHLARSVNVRFAFRGVAASRIDDVKLWMLQVDPKEAVAVNCIMQLHKLLDDQSRIDNVLKLIHSLNPKIVTLVEQDTNHNQAEFSDRFREALYYYSSMFDSLEACKGPQKWLAEIHVQREICNVVCCIEMHETLAMWKQMMNGNGFEPVCLGANAYKQASMLLTVFSAQAGYSVDESEGCLKLGWHNRPLIAASAWRPNSKM
ncbi:DELLA domain-containing protein [Heracleum sosnowskyi]|uniref:DELLA protein n=1 Tax=Heracleum sosnowskyi TaxID=360622 RepID=A0AAD8N1R3_9APIA|nr:DELLA domain-containing protein [Heracleum sosnowskyi]